MRMQVASLQEGMCGLYASRRRDEPVANIFHRMYISTRGRLRHVVTLNQVRNGELQLPRRCRHEARIKVGDTRNATNQVVPRTNYLTPTDMRASPGSSFSCLAQK